MKHASRKRVSKQTVVKWFIVWLRRENTYKGSKQDLVMEEQNKKKLIWSQIMFILNGKEILEVVEFADLFVINNEFPPTAKLCTVYPFLKIEV